MAFAATCVWEVRTTGNDANGGGFDPTSGTPGTDYSQQTSPQVTFADLVIDPTTNTNCTSIANPFTSAHVGNILNITSGTGFTVQRVQVMSVSSGIATCDKSLGTLSSVSGNGKLGGCLASWGTVANLPTSGNKVWGKATAAYTITANITFSNNATAGSPIVYEGYTTTRGDNGQVTVQITSAATNVFLISGSQLIFKNFILDANSISTTICARITGQPVVMVNCKYMNFTSKGVSVEAYAYLENIFITGGTSAATGGLSVSNKMRVVGGRITANACNGVQLLVAGLVIDRVIIDANTGASSDGIQLATAGATSSPSSIMNCSIYNNGRHGIFGSGAGSYLGLEITNSIIVNNGGYGVSSTTTNYLVWESNYNAFYNNTSGARNNVPSGSNDVTLTGVPFTNAGSGDFSLNSTAGAGASCRASGFPGAAQSGGTGYLDSGSLQHADPAAAVRGAFVSVGSSVGRGSSI